MLVSGAEEFIVPYIIINGLAAGFMVVREIVSDQLRYTIAGNLHAADAIMMECSGSAPCVLFLC